ncbi:hypothetical protein FE392_12455 [Xenorhabdus sp. 12]|uniref:Uncharacterized protein n=1 Tax=Xenorhabdus santafensis TaxID=2582833 RepID=A0ABU4SBG5_9GAMM|nr:hypothetical protein [Xenorhabdus sp. 12]
MSLDYHLMLLRKLLSVRKIKIGYFYSSKRDFILSIWNLMKLYIVYSICLDVSSVSGNILLIFA